MKMRSFLKSIVILLVVTVFMLPFIWLLSASLMSTRELMNTPPQWLPAHPQWSNYVRVFKALPIGKYYRNSLIVSVSVVVLQVFTSVCAGYALAKFRFRGRTLAFGFALVTMMIPNFLFVVPLYCLMAQFGVLRTHLGLILPYIGSGYGIFLSRQFMLSIPDELLDAARIDGSSELGIFGRIVLPLAKPLLATLAVICFISIWRDFLWPVIVTTGRPYLQTVPIGIQALEVYYSPFENLDLRMAALVLQVLPPAAMFMVLQKYYVRGVLLSGFGGT